MLNITVETKDNGFKAEGIQGMIKQFEKAAEILFPGCTVHHFYYGDGIDMADIILESKNYAHFNISKNRVSFNGHSCTFEEYEKFASMTYNDECFAGRLFDITK